MPTFHLFCNTIKSSNGGSIFSAASFNFPIRRRISAPSSPSINLLTIPAISFPSTMPFSSSLTLNPTFNPSLTNAAFIPCSPNSGHPINGTPCTILSRVEFHPQWVRKPPTAACWRISICGAQFRCTKPFTFCPGNKIGRQILVGEICCIPDHIVRLPHHEQKSLPVW